MQKRKPIVGITQGDSNGIGYEVIIKAISDPRVLEFFTPVVYGSSKLFGFYRKSIPEIDQMDTNVITSAQDAKPKRINILNCLPENVFAEPGQATPESAKAAIMALDKAVEDIKEGTVDVLVTGPINKKAMSGQGFGFPGHTEYLQKQFGVKDVTMLMTSHRLKLGVVTGHIPLKDVVSSVTKDKIISKLRLMTKSLKEDFCIDQPRIAVLSLNPHSGDGGLLGSEEGDIIIPAIAEATAEGILAYGPFSPDGFFGLGHYERFDATLAMYHDQGLAPFKALSFEDGVNYTAGLPIVRTSPDHGTAFELAGRDEADPQSMRSAIFTAVDIFNARKDYAELQEGKMEERRLEGTERRERNGRPQIA
ncbi:MAG: 4-hydroxythreonine-4-phosphate dehydrogenase PdxA [Bacteroidales bacterium]|nr:4-hydroxythreonine-4-phosphate dehydrogenase PdxA [Bacteroidales bacterium]